MAALFQTGNGEIADKINVSLQLDDNVWLKAALLHALSLMCQEHNWQLQGDATIEFARDKANEMFESVLFDVVQDMTPVGSYLWSASANVPERYLLCDGSQISREQFADLFAEIGTLYGAGDGSSTFGIPNMTGRSHIMAGYVPIPEYLIGLGAAFGEYNHTLITAEMPAHNHRIGKASATNSAGSARPAAVARTNDPATPDMVTDSAGTGAAHNTVHPVLGANCFIYTGVIF